MSRTRTANQLISRLGVLSAFVLAVLASAGVGVATAATYKPTYPQPYPWSRTASVTTGDYVADSYNGVAAGTPIENVTTDRLLDVLSNNGTYYILLSGPEHATGQAAVQQIDAEARADGITKIYHFDPYVDGYRLDISDTTSGGVGSWTGGTSVNYGGTAKVSDVWKLITGLLPSSATATGGALYGYTGDQTLLLSITITDRTNVQTGKVINASYKLSPADLPTFDPISARAAISNVFHQGPGGTVIPGSQRTQYQFFKRLYDSSASYINSGTPSLTKIGGPVTIFSDSDYPNGGDGFPLVSLDIKDAYDVLNSPGEHAFLFAGQGCHNTQAIIGSVALRAKQLGLSKVYVVDFALDSNVKFGTGSLIDTTLNNSATGGLWIRNNATLAGAYKFSYLYGELANYFGPNWVTENSTKKNSSIAYYHNGDIQPSSLTSGGVWVAGNTNPNATRLQVPTLIAYNRDAVNPVTHTWLHRDSGLSTSTPVYDEYMLELAWVRHTPLSVASTTTYIDGLTRVQFADEAVSALDNVLAPVQSYVASFSTSPTPTITGTPEVGQTLSAQTGTWFPTPDTFGYQWNADGVAIPGATSSTYYVTSDVIGKQIAVTVTANKVGFPSTSETSSPTSAVLGDFTTVGAPTINGIYEVGRTLTVDAGTWGPTPDLLTYQWYSNGAPILGATGPTYLTTDGDTCLPIRVEVTAHKAFFNAVTVTSAETPLLEPNSGPVAFTTAPTPTVTGLPVVGHTLTADAGSWSPTPDSLSYQWSADGAPISGATSSTYTLTAAEVGKQIGVTVTGAKTDYATTPETSALTSVVAPVPSLTTLSAYNGAPGTAITISGSGFGATEGASLVTFGGATTTATSWSDTQITVTVPAGASIGYVGVIRNGVYSNGLYFVPFAAPSLTGLSAHAAPIGSTITIHGTGFGASEGAGVVTFGGVTTTALTWTDTAITVAVPAGAPTGYVGVWQNGVVSNGLLFAPGSEPAITSVSANVASIGTTVTITGIGFGATQGSSSLTLGGIAITPLTWSNTAISFVVPSNATAGYLGVVNAGISSNGAWLQPVARIDALSNWWGAASTEVTITGAGFGATQGASSVTFGGVPATVSSWSDTAIVVSVPASAGPGYVGVWTNGFSSNGVYFLPVTPAVISSVSPGAASIGSTITISGSGFGATQGAGDTVTVAGINASIVSWSNTSIKAIVPVGATTGYVGVWKSGVSSNGSYLVVTP